MNKKTEHPMQPIVWDKRRVIRFKANPIVAWLLDNGGLDMNDIAVKRFKREDQEQFAQLIGYSVSGFGELSYATRATVQKADDIAEAMVRAKKRSRK